MNHIYIYTPIFCMYVCLVPECMKIQLTCVLTYSMLCVYHIDYSPLYLHLNHVKSKLPKCVYVCEYCVNMDVSDTQGNLTQVNYPKKKTSQWGWRQTPHWIPESPIHPVWWLSSHQTFGRCMLKLILRSTHLITCLDSCSQRSIHCTL